MCLTSVIQTIAIGTFQSFRVGSSLQYLAAWLQSVCFPHFLACLNMAKIEYLNLVAYGRDHLKLHHHQILRAAERIQLVNLFTFHLSGFKSNNQWFSWFMENFNFSAVSIMNITPGIV